jgi:hypothetical protein
MELEIDLTPRHLIEWLRADLALGSAATLAVRATREFLVEPAPLAGGDFDEEDEMASVTTVGLVEVTPCDGSGRWTLRLRVEDPLGSHLPEDGSVPDEPEEIGLERFADSFLLDAEPDATVTLEADTAADRRRFERVLARMLADRHEGRA